MAASQQDELTLDIPASTLGNYLGISCDMGGSVLKVVYVDQDVDTESNETVTLKFRSFPRTEIEDALTFLKTLPQRRGGSGQEVPVMYTTGLGLQNWGPRIEKELNIKVENIMETLCFVKAANYCLKKLPEKTFSAELSKEAVKKGQSRAGNIVKMYAMSAERNKDLPRQDGDVISRFDTNLIASLPAILNDVTTEFSDEPLGGEEGVFPFLLGMLGSGFAVLKVFEDCSYQMMSMNPLGGRTLMSLGSLMVGAKGYDELIELARRGNSRELNVYLHDLITADGMADGYARAATMLDSLSYSFGKAQGKSLSDFAREDVASGLLRVITHNIMLEVVNLMQVDGCKHFLATGSFPNTDLTQDIMIEEFIHTFAARGVWRDKISPARLHIPKCGAYFGALGAFLNGCDKEK